MSSTDQPHGTTGTVDYLGYQTWYRVTGNLDPGADKAPVVIVHGGPGMAHNYCLAMADLAGDGRAVIHYDQLGCGNSTHLPDRGAEFWTVQLFVRELRNLVDALGVGTRFHLLGQSWGGMLSPEFMVADGKGVLSLTICDSPASMPLWLDAAATLRAELPEDVQEALQQHEDAGTTDSAGYQEAVDVFYAKHVCRVQPLPQDVQDSFDQADADPTVYYTMNGPSEFHVIGTLKEWSIVDRLEQITIPTLVVAGSHDEAMPMVWRPFLDRIPGAHSHVFPDSSHMPHIEEREDFTAVVGSFLREHDTPHQEK